MEAQASKEMKDAIEDTLAYGYKTIKNRKDNIYDVFLELCKNHRAESVEKGKILIEKSKEILYMSS